MSHTELEPQIPASARLVSVDGKTYPLESAELKARAEGGMAATTLIQTFANPYAEPLEVLYTLPLPADGAVLGYTITIGDRVIRGEVQPREKAAAAYKQALYEGRTAGLLEQQRADTFEQKLGNVPPGTKVQVSIDVLHPLAFLTPELPPIVGEMIAQLYDARRVPNWEYRFPTVVGVRYQGAPGRVPDATELSPDRGAAWSIPVRMGFELGIGDALLALPTSPSHTIEHAAEPSYVVIHGQPLDRDVVIRWPAATAEIGVHITEGLGLPGDDGRYALVTVAPPAQPKTTYRRDVTVLLDASGSMSGLPLDLAKVVVGDLLRSLQPGDRFELLAFSSGTTRLTPALTNVNERSLASALASLGKVQAGGGTEMASAVTEALKSTRDDAQRQVVLVTDGDIGFEHEVVGQITSQRNVRLHVVGVGHMPNRTLTQQAAAAGRGLELLVTTHADASAASQRLIVGTANPVLTNVSVGGTALAGNIPAQLRDVFAGQPLVFAVELSRMGGSFEVTGTLAGSASPWRHKLTVQAADAEPSDDVQAVDASALPLGALYGREVVARLELTRAGLGYHVYRPHDETASTRLDHEIEHVAMRHRIVSRRTSLVAIAEEPSVDPRAPRRRERLAVEVPAGVSAAGVGLEFEHTVLMSVSMPRAAAGAMMDRAPMAPPPTARSAGSDLFELSKRMFRRGPKPPAEGGEVPSKFEEFESERQRLLEQADRARRFQEWFRQLRLYLRGHVIRWVSKDTVEIEFKLEHDGQFPEHYEVEIEFRDAKGGAERAVARVVHDKSSCGFNVGAGMVVRLALQLPPGKELPAGQEILVRWTSELVAPAHDRIPFETLLHVRMPERITPDDPPSDSKRLHPTE